MIEREPQMDWDPASWQALEAGHQPLYTDRERLDRVVTALSRLPQLVTSGEIEALKQKIAEAQRGEAFLLQGGDCAESFEDCTAPKVTAKLKILLQMSLVLLQGMETRIIRVGRMAGQYAKPRSTTMEKRGDQEYPSYFGDLINRVPFTEDDRTPDPELMLRGYERSALTLNFIRALVDGGFADLHHPERWDLSFMAYSPLADRYREVANRISRSLKFMETVSGAPIHETSRVDFYTSHEGLHLLYEQAVTHYIQRRGRWYNGSTHFPWIGMRTADPDGAHVEYFRGIANPIAIKVGPGMNPEVLEALLDRLDPDHEPGRITLIHRFGADRIQEHLPPLVKIIQDLGRTVLWSADPMHGNTEVTERGIKTRRFDRILSELGAAFRIHEEMGSRLGGIHIELTGEPVTECVGGARGLDEDDLEKAYLSQVDPRLNYEQALELALRIADRRFEGA